MQMNESSDKEKKTVRKDLSGLPSSGRSLLCLSYHVHTDCNF